MKYTDSQSNWEKVQCAQYIKLSIVKTPKIAWQFE